MIPGQVGVIGTSKGGDIALMMATHSPKVTLCRMLFTLYTRYIVYLTVPMVLSMKRTLMNMVSFGNKIILCVVHL